LEKNASTTHIVLISSILTNSSLLDILKQGKGFKSFKMHYSGIQHYIFFKKKKHPQIRFSVGIYDEGWLSNMYV